MTKNQQLSQIHKLDDEAVRTARITFVVCGLLVGGVELLPSPRFSFFGVFGTVSLIGSLVASLFVYGTSRHFIGSRPDELPLDYSKRPSLLKASREIIDRYERGTRRNRRVLHSSALFLGLSRLLLAVAVVLFVSNLVFHYAV